jgi:oligopeptidase B
MRICQGWIKKVQYSNEYELNFYPMKTKKDLLLFSMFILLMTNACKNTGPLKVVTQADYPPPPVAAVIPDTLTDFGNRRIDQYFWMKDKSNPAVMAYLKAENSYCDTVMGHTKGLQEKLFSEMKGRIKEDDQSVPQLDNGYYYYTRTEKDKQYSIYCRRKGDLSSPETVFFDGNKMAEGTDAFLFAGYKISSDNKLAAYAYNTTGSYAEFSLKIRDLNSGTDLPFEVRNAQSFAWANDGKTLFYTISNSALRPFRVYRHIEGSIGKDVLIFEENDEAFDVYVSKSRTREFIYIVSASKTSTEYRCLNADRPLAEFKVFMHRQKDVEYYIQHHKSGIFIRYKDLQNRNAKIFESSLSSSGDFSTWKEVVKHDPAVKIQDFDVFEKFLALYIRKNGLDGIEVIDMATGVQKSVSFPEPVYVVNPISTPEYKAVKYRYTYSSMNRPNTVYDYDMTQGVSEKLKEQEIPGGFHADTYTVERIWAPAPDGKQIPMALLYRKSLEKNGKNPALLVGYGAYGFNTDAGFRQTVFSLVDRGFVFAIAQVRGGSEMGEQWYDDGKILNKKKTFSDFIACAEYLIKEKYTAPEKLGIMGGSAGGLLMGAVVNMRPDLFHVVLALVPFVDVVTTMQDKNLPLTTQEYEEWGNPGNEEVYRYMLSYAPYDNVVPKPYPNILVTAGWNDSQVMYHEPMKWVAKLRALKTDNNIILLKTNMESGHGGATGRFDYLKDIAFEYAFLMDRLGIKE